MKTSKKLIIGFAVLITTMLIVSMILIRDRIQTKFADRINDPRFKKVEVTEFKKLNISSNWDVTVKKGLDFKVEVSTASNAHLKVVDGVLIMEQDSTGDDASEKTTAKITTPVLREIKALKNTTIVLRDFLADSLKVDIQDGCVFTGTDNQFKHVSFKSTGDARIEMSDTPDL